MGFRVTAVLLVALAAPAAAQPPAAAALTDAEKERFLRLGKVVRRRAAPEGVTGSAVATLSLDGLEHDAHVQEIDVQKHAATMSGGTEVDFRDSWRCNVAAYRLDRLLGLGMVPVTVAREEGKAASYTWWVDDVLMNEKTRLKTNVRSPDVAAWNAQMYALRIFDQLIYNFDRNVGNLVIDTQWRIWMIDHSRAFKKFKTLKSPKNLGSRCPRGLLAALRRLDKGTLEAELADLLSVYQMEGLLGRRDAIVRHFDAVVAREGEGPVLYDLPPRGTATSAPR
jgi:hypothetical protein